MRRVFLNALLILLFASPVLGQTPFFQSVKFGALVQFWNQFSNNRWDETFHYVRMKAKGQVDEQTSFLVMPVLSASGGFTLLDAFVKRDLGNDWLVTVGQFKFVFGCDRTWFPDELKRVDYAKMDKFAFPGNPWDMGIKVEKTLGEITTTADLIQGAGPNVFQDTNNTKDISGRVDWRKGDFRVGGSYYGGTCNGTSFTNFQSWFGAHALINTNSWDARVEAVWAPVNNAYLAQLAYKTGDLEPLVYGELGFTGTARSYQLLGAGFNWRVAPKTRLSWNGTLNGVNDFSGPAVGILQIEQVF